MFAHDRRGVVVVVSLGRVLLKIWFSFTSMVAVVSPS